MGALFSLASRQRHPIPVRKSLSLFSGSQIESQLYCKTWLHPSKVTHDDLEIVEAPTTLITIFFCHDSKHTHQID